MKQIQARITLGHSAVFRPCWGKVSVSMFTWLAVVIGSLLSGTLVHAQTPILRFSFEDGGLTTTTNTQGGFVLTNFNAAGTAADIHGPPGSGISGQLDNN